MILYNVTCKVHPDVHDDWVRWMKAIHIPDVMKTGLFVESWMTRILNIDDDDGPTYTIQYKLEREELFDTYQKQFAPGLQKDHIDRYGDKVLAFRTMMEIVESFD